MRCTRGGIWKGDILVADTEELEQMDASEIHAKKTQCKGSVNAHEWWKVYTPIADGTVKLIGGDQVLRTSTSIRDRPERGEEQERGIRRIFFNPTSRLIVVWWWSWEWFLVLSGNFIYRHHVEPRVKLYSPREESFIPSSTEIHWCIQNYSYEFGCQARETHRLLLEYRWVSRLVRSLDRVHSVYSIRSETSRRIFVVREEINKKTAYIQARSSMARVMEVNGKERQAEGKAKMVWRKDSSWQRSKIARDLLHRPWGQGIQGDHQECSQEIGNTSGSCYALQDEQEQSEPNYHEDHIVGKGTIHYSITI